MIKLVVATPMYGGACSGAYNVSVGQLRQMIIDDGGRCGVISLGNESLVNRARNSIVYQFLNATQADWLLFCDADQGFKPDDVMRMIAAEKTVIAAPVPLKGLDWEAIGKAARAGVPDDRLHLYGGIFNVEHLEGERSLTDPFEVGRVGCAFMLIHRSVFEKLARLVPLYIHDLPDEMEGAEVSEFFPTGVFEGRLMSEDYGFLNAWRRLGGHVWLAPWVDITHYGTFAFTGSYGVKHAPLA